MIEADAAGIAGIGPDATVLPGSPSESVAVGTDATVFCLGTRWDNTEVVSLSSVSRDSDAEPHFKAAGWVRWICLVLGRGATGAEGDTFGVRPSAAAGPSGPEVDSPLLSTLLTADGCFENEASACTSAVSSRNWTSSLAEEGAVSSVSELPEECGSIPESNFAWVCLPAPSVGGDVNCCAIA